MATIQSTIKLHDQMSATLDKITGNLQLMMNTMTQNNTLISASTTNITNNITNINESAQSASSSLDGLVGRIKQLAAAAGGLAAIKSLVGMSDEMTSMSARLDMVLSSAKSTEDSIDSLTSKIYAAADASRGSFGSMASLITRLGINAADAFSSTDELIKFSETVSKAMTVSGASATEADAAMLQLSQALASGVLRGDELNSIFEQAPILIKTIAEQMDVPIGQIRSMASEGELTADVVKNALLAGSGEIDAMFESMPQTFGQAMTSLQNQALQAFTPVLNQLNGMLNSSSGSAVLSAISNNIYTIANIASSALTVVGGAFDFVVQHADTFSTALQVVLGVVGTYNAVMAIAAALNVAHGVATGIARVALTVYANAANGAAAAQAAFNTVLGLCPLVWIAVAIAAVVAGVILLANHIANTGGVASSAFAVICGWVNVAKESFVWLWETIKTVASNIPIAFHNACADAATAFYSLLSAASTAILGIAQMLSAIPGISFDTSGLEAAASNYAAKANKANSSKIAYNEIGSFDYKSAYNAGASWGNSFADKLSSKLDGGSTDYTSSLGDLANYESKTAANTADTAGSAGSINNKLDDTEEDLKYLCDIAERDAINRFTTASIAIDMVNNNSISSGMDLDTIIDGMTSRLQTSMSMIAEGA